MRRVFVQFRAETMLVVRNGEQLLLTLAIPVMLLTGARVSGTKENAPGR